MSILQCDYLRELIYSNGKTLLHSIMILRLIIVFSVIPLFIICRKNYNARCFIVGMLFPFINIFFFKMSAPRAYPHPYWTYIWMDDPFAYKVAAALSLQTFYSVFACQAYALLISRLCLTKEGNYLSREGAHAFGWAFAGFTLCVIFAIAPYEFCMNNFIGTPIP